MREEAVQAVIEGLKGAGVDIIIYMPDSDFSPVLHALRQDPGVQCVPTSSEAIAIATAAGSWLGGKTPAVLLPTSGLLVAGWPLASICFAWEIPVMLLIPYRGDIGDGAWVMRTYQHTTIPLLEALRIPYKVVSQIPDIQPTIINARRSMAGWLDPIAILLTGEALW